MAMVPRPIRVAVTLTCALAAWVCTARCGGGNTTAPTLPPTSTGPVGQTGPTGVTGTPITEILVGAGDIGYNGTDGAQQTGKLISNIGGQIFTAGDNAYFNATAEEFRRNYDPFWGGLDKLARTRPVPGNHEYDPPADPNNYYDYFGGNAGPRGRGYYSYPVGDWHVIALNSALRSEGGFVNGSTQIEWLKQDLAQYRNSACTLAIWHHPLFSSGENGNQAFTRDAWTWLYQAGAEIVVNGHDHSYEVFAPQTPDGIADGTYGIREFVVGTGGARSYSFITNQPNSQKKVTPVYGVLKLTLSTGSYRWEFITAPSGAVADSGGPFPCHAPPGSAQTSSTAIRRR
jgi:hypothetical protein